MIKKISVMSVAVFAVVALSGCFGQQNTNTQEENLKRDGNLRNNVEKEMIPVEANDGISDGAQLLPGDDDSVMEKQENNMMEADKTSDVFADAEAVALKDVSGGSATGETFTVVKDGKTDHRMTAQNLPATTNGDFYEGWIVSSPSAPGGVISTGEMTQRDDGTWLLEYTADEELPDHKTIVLTLEPDDGDSAPAKHILEGKTK